MKIGVVIGTVVATRKCESMVGNKLLLTQPVNIKKEAIGEPFVAVDSVGAGVGDFVLYASGTASRNSVQKPKSSIDASIIGIIDNVDIHPEVLEEK